MSDFGLSRLLPESHVHLKDKLATEDVAGTVTHMAPELLSGDPMSAAADVYAFAILSKLTFSAADVNAFAILVSSLSALGIVTWCEAVLTSWLYGISQILLVIPLLVTQLLMLSHLR